MQTGPITETTGVTCCGAPVQAITLTAGTRRQVELLRCAACGASRWRLDGTEVDKDTALGALNAVFASPTPARRPARRRPEPTAEVSRPAVVEVPGVEPVAAAEPIPAQRPADLPAALSELLAGWTVLGAS